MIATVLVDGWLTVNLLSTVWVDDWFSAELISNVLFDGLVTET